MQSARAVYSKQLPPPNVHAAAPDDHCPTGSFCPAQSAAAKQCAANTYCPANAVSATNCPSGTKSAAGSGSASDCKPPTAPYTKVPNTIMSNLWEYNNSAQWNRGEHYTDDASGLAKALALPKVRAINILPGTRIDVITGEQGGPRIRLRRANGWDVYVVDPTMDKTTILPENAF